MNFERKKHKENSQRFSYLDSLHESTFLHFNFVQKSFAHTFRISRSEQPAHNPGKRQNIKAKLCFWVILFDSKFTPLTKLWTSIYWDRKVATGVHKTVQEQTIPRISKTLLQSATVLHLISKHFWRTMYKSDV